MSDTISLRVRRAREQIAVRRDAIRQAHAAGASSLEVVTSLAAVVDGVIAGLLRPALAGLGPAAAVEFASRISLVALGGYGRLELAPYSDVDFLFLYHPSARNLARELCEQLVRDTWDAGLALGSSLRTISESLALAAEDISVHTALLEARLLFGSRDLAAGLSQHLARLTWGARRGNAFIDAVRAERTREQEKFGSAVHLLQPDVKKSKGGLRDLHLLRWAARVRYGLAGLDDLGRVALSAHDVATLRPAQEFLLRVRNDLHFHAGRAQDDFTLNDQVRVAEAFGYKDQPGMLAVEQFMQQYYRHGDALADVAERFVSACRRPSLWSLLLRPLRARRLGEFVLVDGRIAPAPGHESAALGSLERMISLFATAAAHGASVETHTRDQVRLALASLETPDSGPACRAFLEMLNRPGHLGPTLHAMHGVGLLEKIIPEFAHARGLIQFNQYHKYAVDEHTLLCVAQAEALAQSDSSLGKAYAEIHHKGVLHLALLMHDLGKGFDNDHSEVGRVIAQREVERFELAPQLGEMLVFLVHQHLLMSNLAFRRDTSDERALAEFVRKVGTPEVLRMLYVFTAVDIQAVGPTAWTSWKADILHEVYTRCLELLTGEVVAVDTDKQAAAVRREVMELLRNSVPTEALHRHLDAMSRQDLLAAPPAEIAAQLRAIHELDPGSVLTTNGYYNAATGTCRYTIYAYESLTPGIFSKMTGVLAAKGLHILGARITTHEDGVVVDRFEVIDPDFNGKPPPGRLKEVGEAIRAVLLGERSVESLFTPRFTEDDLTPASHLPSTRVVIDNDTSDRYTIIEVFARDRLGLLYAMARCLFELGLSVSVAKIATSGDQILDVFYVTDQAEGKVTGDDRLEHIRQSLAQAIDDFETTRLQVLS
jgi:[protein-PII] uridylyltransferase